MAGKHSFNFIEAATAPEAEPILSALLASAIVFLVFKVGLGKIRAAKNPLIPDKTLTIRNIGELATEFILGLGDNLMGRHNRRFLPFVATVFIYIFVMNVMGLVPGFSGPTDGIPGGVAFNLGIGLVVFFMYFYWGIKEIGLKATLKHMNAGMPVSLHYKKFPFMVIGALIFLIEVLSHALRPFTLSVRLGGNMMADHMVLGSFTDLTAGTIAFFIPVIFYFLGAFVCFMQAFVFTLLSMVYIGLATDHAEDH